MDGETGDGREVRLFGSGRREGRWKGGSPGRRGRVALLAEPSPCEPELAEALLAAHVELGEGLVVVEGERIVTAGAGMSRLLGYTVGDLTALGSYLDLVVPEQRTRVHDLWRLHLCGQTLDARTTYPLLHQNGHWIEVEVVFKPLPTPDGGRMLLLHRDLTEQRRLEEQLRAARRHEAAGRLASQVAHEANNLLTPFAGYPELIRLHLPAGSPALSLCDALIGAAQRLSRLNDDLLSLGHRAQGEREPVELNRLVDDALASQGWGDDGITVERRLARDLAPVHGLAPQLTRAVGHLLANAHAAARGASARVSIASRNVPLTAPVGDYPGINPGDYVSLTIGGAGELSEVDAAGLLDGFFEPRRPARWHGTELGRQIVEAAIEEHGGYVVVHGVLGLTAACTVYLPAAPVRDREVEGETPRGGGETVLVVEDEAEQRRVLLRLLGLLGYRASAVASGDAALAAIRTEPTDLLLLDLELPGGIDGAETYRQALALRPGQRAIVLTGQQHDPRGQTALKLGAGAFLRKPVTLTELARAVRAELERPYLRPRR